jgi:SAM-dependent methyltransferase
MSEVFKLEETSIPWSEINTLTETAAAGTFLQGREVLHHLAARAGEALLDLGCGRHQLPTYAVRQGLDVTGLEYTAEAAAFSQKREPAARVVVGSLPDIPFDAETFDLLTCLELPLGLENPCALLPEIQRVLRPGGRACLLLPNANYYHASAAAVQGRAFREFALSRLDWEKRLWSSGLDIYHARPDWSLERENHTRRLTGSPHWELGAFLRRHCYELAPAIFTANFAFFCRKA